MVSTKRGHNFGLKIVKFRSSHGTYSSLLLCVNHSNLRYVHSIDDKGFVDQHSKLHVPGAELPVLVFITPVLSLPPPSCGLSTMYIYLFFIILHHEQKLVWVNTIMDLTVHLCKKDEKKTVSKFNHAYNRQRLKISILSFTLLKTI